MDFDFFLKNKNIKATTFRVRLLEILHKNPYPIMAKDIEEQWEAPIDRVTLYRTLKTFVNHNIIHRIEISDSVTGYNFIDPSSTNKPNKEHPHFYCNTCNKVICLPDYMTNLKPLPDGFTQKTMNIVIKGICDNCNEENKQ